MYQPGQFRLEDVEPLRLAIEQSPFATLVTQSAEGGLTADHLPLLFEPSNSDSAAGDKDVGDVLRGHIARANPLASAAFEHQALAIFHGPQAYITPSWYPAKREHGKVVPTWNYEVVHVHGRLRLIDDPAWLLEVVGALTDRFENQRPSPWSIDDAPADFISRMCRAIIGIELTVERVEGKRKASQHKPSEERQAIYQGLQGEYGYSRADAKTLSGID